MMKKLLALAVCAAMILSLCAVAQAAEQVTRVVCGIGVRIK